MIRQEAESIEKILRKIWGGSIQWVASEALVEEIDNNPEVERRLQNSVILQLAREIIQVNDQVARGAKELTGAGYGPYDALHLASAEAGKADVLLTTDDGFRKRALRAVGAPQVAIVESIQRRRA